MVLNISKVSLAAPVLDAPASVAPEQSPAAENKPRLTDFQEWYSQSNLFNSNGSPLLLYHGTNKTFEKFRRSKIGAMGSAVYLGDERCVAACYNGDGSRRQIIMELYARGKYLNNMQWTDYVSKHGWVGVHDTKFESSVAVWDPDNIITRATAELMGVKNYLVNEPADVETVHEEPDAGETPHD